MDWDTYKKLSDHPLYWTHWMLEQCIDLLIQLQETSLAARLRTALQSSPLPTPTDHVGPLATQMFAVRLCPDEGEAVLAALRRAEQLGLATEATANRGLGGFVAAWTEYVHAQRSCADFPELSSCIK